jgi:ABC-type transporter Mla subunit MlaD
VESSNQTLRGLVQNQADTITRQNAIIDRLQARSARLEQVVQMLQAQVRLFDST